MSTITASPALSEASRLAEDGKLELAAQHVMGHLRANPGDPRALALLGSVAMRLGALGQSEAFLRQALAREPTTEARRHLASNLNQQERLAEALDLFRALERESGDPGTAALVAITLDKLGRNEEALAIQERLTAANPDRPAYWVGYGHNLRAAGRVPEAIAAYRRAVTADFEFGEGWWGLASIKQKIFTDEDIVAMREGLRIAIDIRNSAPLHFSLARALHDRERHEEAFTHYVEGNRQRAESIGYDASELTAEIAEVERVVDPAFIASLNAAPVGDATPVFIVSLPRSGSTLLEQMLASHSQVEAIGELPYIPAILRTAMEMATRRGRVTVPQIIASLPPEVATAMGQDYLRRAALHRKTDRPFFVDKLPHNWSNILFIKRILPQARFLDIRRPAMDCCFSNFTQSFSTAHASSFTLKDIGQCYVDYVRLMDHLNGVAPGLVHHVSYDRLIEDAETQLRAALDYLGLHWDPAVLEFHRLDRVVRTPSSEQVRRPLNRDGVDVWKPYSQWLDPLRETLGPLAV
ncbi:tetratricopeptide repeat-containing sulfotransferase family protein [Sphingomonas sp. LT1P40]|uniref:tetratricopeptide repeat-containing sulfotransferase family protein n=1 Tax=Alteristakelama amylovorans TaxID=3096166 RepID=UPI002FCCAC32